MSKALTIRRAAPPRPLIELRSSLGSDAAVILDVRHCVDPVAQQGVLERMRSAPRPHGHAISRWVDRRVTRVRGRRRRPTFGRTLDDRTAQLARLGFTITAVPMSQGTPFANVLRVADRVSDVVGPAA